jgi:hypothetical protein
MEEHLIRRLFQEQLRGWRVSGAKSNPLGCLAAASAVDGRSGGIVIRDQVRAQLVQRKAEAEEHRRRVKQARLLGSSSTSTTTPRYLTLAIPAAS